VKPSQALIPDNGIASLIDSKHLKKIFNREKHYVSEDIDEEGLNYLKDIGVERFTCNDLFEEVFPNTEWLKKRPQRWFIELYGLLWDWIQSQGYHGSWERTRAINRIKEARIFLSESKKLMVVEDKKRHLYRLEQRQAAFAHLFKTEYELFNQNLYARIFSDATKNPEEKEAREKARQLISATLPTLSVEKILDDIIKPAFRDWINQTDAKLLRYTDFVRQFVENIKDDMILLRREGEEKSYMSPSEMFMLPEYGADGTMRKLFGEKDVPFVSKHYIQKLLERTSERSKDQITSWTRLFQKLGVNERPIVVKIVEDREHSEIEQELQKYYPKNSVESSNWGYRKRDYNFIAALAEIIDSLQNEETPERIEKAKLVLKIMNDNWDYYRKFMKSYYLYHVPNAYEQSKAELGPSSLALTIKEKPWVPTLKGEIAEPSHVFLNLQAIKESMGDQVEYVDGDINNRSLINFAGFNDKPSVKAALNHLRGLTERNVDDYDAFRRSFIFFRDFLRDQKSLAKEGDAVIRAFKSEPLIFIPGHKTKPYRKHTEVGWSGPSFLSDFKPNLERYFDLESFFLDRIGVAPEPTINDYMDFLIYLSNKESLNSSEQEAMLSARGKLNDALADEAKEISAGKQRTEKQEKMLRNLRKKGKVWCDDKTWAFFYDELYYNDSPHIYSIFKDILKTVYLDPRKGSKLPLHFLREFQINGLKESVREVAPDIEEEVLREASEEETEKIRSLVPYLCGFIKKNESEVFEELRQENKFSQFAFMSIRIVGELRTHYHINGIRRPNPDKNRAFYDESSNTLYLAGGLHDSVDDIGMTLSEALGDVPGLVDFIPRLVNLDKFERQNVIQRRRMEWIDVDDDVGADGTDRKDEKQEGDDKAEPVKPKERPKKRPVTKPEKKAFDSEAYLDEIDSLLASVSVTHIDEEDLQEMTGAGRQGASGGGGGSWYGLTDEQKKQIGDAAEKVVYRKEKERLKNLFENGLISQDLSEKINHIAERDDSAGYDIQSLNEKGDKIYIEVKGTSDAVSMEFPISREEFKKAEEKGDSYFIYRVLNVGDGKKPAISVIKNPFKLWRKNKLRLISKKLLMGVELK
jgi:hypothetical protein